MESYDNLKAQKDQIVKDLADKASKPFRDRIAELEVQLAEAQADNAVLIDALDNIAYPIKHMQAETELEGGKLDGALAIRLSENPNHLKQIAKYALSNLNSGTSLLAQLAEARKRAEMSIGGEQYWKDRGLQAEQQLAEAQAKASRTELELNDAWNTADDWKKKYKQAESDLAEAQVDLSMVHANNVAMAEFIDDLAEDIKFWERGTYNAEDICNSISNELENPAFQKPHPGDPIRTELEQLRAKVHELEDVNESIRNWNACEEQDYKYLLAELDQLRAVRDAAEETVNAWFRGSGLGFAILKLKQVLAQAKGVR